MTSTEIDLGDDVSAYYDGTCVVLRYGDSIVALDPQQLARLLEWLRLDVRVMPPDVTR